jgi:hypothetical protein
VCTGHSRRLPAGKTRTAAASATRVPSPAQRCVRVVRLGTVSGAEVVGRRWVGLESVGRWWVGSDPAAHQDLPNSWYASCAIVVFTVESPGYRSIPAGWRIAHTRPRSSRLRRFSRAVLRVAANSSGSRRVTNHATQPQRSSGRGAIAKFLIKRDTTPSGIRFSSRPAIFENSRQPSSRRTIALPNPSQPSNRPTSWTCFSRARRAQPATRLSA